MTGRPGIDLSRLTPEQRTLLETRLQERRRRPRSADPDAIPRRKGPGPIPLSLGQHRLWLQQRLDPGSSAYNVRCAFELRGRLVPRALAQAATWVVARHEVLRTRILDGDGDPHGWVDPPAPVELPVVETLDDGRGEALRRDLVEAVATRPFDLASQTPLRICLFRLAPERHLLVVAVHHVASDGWSLDLLFQELAAGYTAFTEGRAPAVSPPAIQYGDYACWQRQRACDGRLEAGLEVWRRRLAGAVPVLERLPGARPSRSGQSTAAAGRTVALGEATSGLLEALARRHEASLFMVLVAGVAALLGRLAGAGDVTLGTPVTGREREELEGLIGFLVQFLPLRVDLSGDPTFETLVTRTRGVVLEAMAHQAVPLDGLNEGSGAHGRWPDPDHQVAFALLAPTAGSPSLAGLEVRPLDLDGGTTKFPLGLTAVRTRRRLLLSATWNVARFEATAAERLAGHLAAGLERLAEHPERPLSALALLTAAERHQAVHEWSRSLPPHRPACLHHLVEERAAAAPDVVAIANLRERLSYGELDARSNRLALHLRARRVGAGTLVPLLLERSVELVVAALAVLKAGGAYVPLDPEHPPARLASMLDDVRRSTPPGAGAPVVICRGEPPAAVPDGLARVDLLRPGGFPVGGRTVAEAGPASSPATDALAYVIYTSGSTGRPKGVQIRHRSASNVILEMTRIFGTGPHDRVLQHASPTFDASVLEIFTALAAGGSLVLAPPGVHAAGTTLAETLRRERITTLAIVPSLLATVPPDDLPDLRQIIVGGESWSPELGRRWAPGRCFLNAYAPTEATIFATAQPVAGGPDEPPASLGRPVAGLEVHLLDSVLEPVPIAGVGEIFLAGEGLSRGYLGMPARTAERFVPHPFAVGPGRRAYRTGDMGRRLPDGRLLFAGRADLQLKVRGLRIEPGEIERVLEDHPAVSRAVVVAHGAAAADRRLLAFVVPEADGAPEGPGLRSFLAERLPASMVPAAFYALDSLPMNANGKVDRRRLPGPDEARRLDGAPRIAPSDGLERRLAAIWSEVLGVDEPGMGDDFFDLGGHSLLIERMRSRVAAELGRSFALAPFFREPTLHHLARLLTAGPGDEAGEAGHGGTLVPLRRGGGHPPLFCVHSLGGDVGGFRSLAERLDRERPFWAFEAPHLTDVTEPAPSIEEMAAGYVRALRRVQPRGPYLLAGYSFGSVVAFEMAHQVSAAGQEVALVALLDGGSPRVLQAARAHHETLVAAGHARDLARQAGIELDLPYETLRTMSPDERIDHLLGKLSTAGILPAGVTREWVARLLAGVRARSRAVREYRPSPYPGRLTLFRSTASEAESARAWRDAGVNVDDPARGWAPLTLAPVEIIPVPGYHATILQEPQVDVLAERLEARIRSAMRPSVAAVAPS